MSDPEKKSTGVKIANALGEGIIGSVFISWFVYAFFTDNLTLAIVIGVALGIGWALEDLRD